MVESFRGSARLGRSLHLDRTEVPEERAALVADRPERQLVHAPVESDLGRESGPNCAAPVDLHLAVVLARVERARSGLDVRLAG